MAVNGVILYRGKSTLDNSPIVVVATGLTRKSENPKTGDIIQTYILVDTHESPVEAVKSGSDAGICGSCVHRRSSCYVNVAQGPTAVYRALQRGSYPVFDPLKHIDLFRGRIIRLGAYGDPAAVPVAVWRTICGVASGWTGYTHQWRECSPEYASYCMASCETPEDREKALAKGYRTFRVRLASQPVEKGEFVCPASAEAGKKKTCAECKACSGQKDGGRNASPVIVVHGLAWKVTRYEETLRRISLTVL